MTDSKPIWTGSSAQIDGPQFATFQRALAAFNGERLDPGMPSPQWREKQRNNEIVGIAECEYIERVREEIAPLAARIPTSGADAFVEWFESLEQTGPGQGDPLFPWLSETATRDDIKWFLYQEVAGEAGFEDLLAMTQVKIPERAKLEMARNYWDEMGRGNAKGMHGALLSRLSEYFNLDPTPVSVVPESLALGNSMVALASHRHYAFHSIGALGVIEMTAPWRAQHVDLALRRLKVPGRKRLYFSVHAILDVKHSEAWNREVLRTLVEEDLSRARAIGEGALIRLWHGARCFERYRHQFGLQERRAA